MKKKSLADERDTPIRLMDAAERLFGDRGYDAVGMRHLAQAARVNLGAATYHYGSKRALYVEAFRRRFRPSSAEQLKLLREAQAHGRRLTVDRIADCMVRPVYFLGLSHPNFSALLARNLVMPPPFLYAALQRELEQKSREFIAALRSCLPNVPEDLIRMRYMFSMGSLLMFSAQIARMSPVPDPNLHDRIFKELVRFISAGLQSEPTVPAAESPPMPRPSRRQCG
jgi:AcrR family transcriptional regulator